MTRSMHRTMTKQQASGAVLYLRVSTSEQAQEGISLAAQEERLLAYCAMRGLTVVEIVRDAGVSAGKPLQSRVGGRRVLELVSRRLVGHVLAYKLDRLFRDCADCLTVTAEWDKGSIAMHLVDMGGQAVDTASAMGRFFLTILAAGAEMEKNLIAERTQEAMNFKKSKGERVGAIPYGFTLAGDGVTLVEHDGEQALLDTVREARARGLSQRAIVAELGCQGFTTRRGSPLSLMQVQRIMQRADIA